MRNVLNPLIICGCMAVLLSACGERAPREAIDTVQVRDTDDVFLGQTPYGLDHSVVILARTPRASYQGGGIVISSGRELVIATPEAWRGYTGLALTTEEAMARVYRARETTAAAGAMAKALRDLNRELQRFNTTVQEGTVEHAATALPPAAAPTTADSAVKDH